MNEMPSSQPPVSGGSSLPPHLSPAPSPNPAPGIGDIQSRPWNMFCHLAALAGYVVPFGNILGPVLVWQIKKNEFPSVDQHGRAAVNFQITVTIATVACILLGFFGSLVGLMGIFFFIAAFGLGLAALFLSIIAGIKANNGELYRYPFSLNIL